MPIIVEKSIGIGGAGAGRDYSTLQAWEDACPANLVTTDQIWKGVCYNDGEFFFTGGSFDHLLSVAGVTVDSTRYLWLTVAPGHSIFDNVNNPLRYDPTLGVGCRRGGRGAAQGSQGHIVFNQTVDGLRIERLQFQYTSSNAAFAYAVKNEAGNNCRFNSGLIHCINNRVSGTSSFVIGLHHYGAPITNSVFIIDFNGTESNPWLITATNGSAITNCTFIARGHSNVLGVSAAYNSNVFKNCAIFGCNGLIRSTPGASSSSSYNIIDGTFSMPGTNNKSARFLDCFNSYEDLRPKKDSPLTYGGIFDSAFRIDPYGTVRTPGLVTVGAIQYIETGKIPFEKFDRALSQLNWANPILSRLGPTRLGVAAVADNRGTKYVRTISMLTQATNLVTFGDRVFGTLAFGVNLSTGIPIWGQAFGGGNHSAVVTFLGGSASTTYLELFNGSVADRPLVVSTNASNSLTITSSGQTILAAGSITITPGVEYTLVVTVSGTTWNIWLNATRIVNNVTVASSNGRETGSIEINNRLGALILVRNYVLNATEITELIKDPYQFFKRINPINTRIFEKQPVKTVPIQTQSIDSTKRYKKPESTAIINWANPLSRGLALASIGGPTFFRDVARDSTFTRGTQTIAVGGGVGGTYVARTGSTAVSPSLYFSAKQASSGGYTVGSVVVDNSGRGVTRSPIDHDAGGSDRIFQLRFTSSNTAEFIPFDTAGTPYGATNNTIVTSSTGLTVLMGRAAGNLGTVFINGINAANTGTMANPAKGLSVNDWLMIGERIGGGNFFTGQIYLSVYWARPLSDAEIVSFSANPWQLFANPIATRYFLPSSLNRSPFEPAFRKFTEQPKFETIAPPPVSIAISGAFPRQNLVDNGKIFTNTNSIISDRYGRATSFDRTSGTGLNTGFAPGTITRHSGVLLVKHRNLLFGNNEVYFSTRTASGNGFAFTATNADGSAPSRTFKLTYTHFGIADYNSTVAISGGDNEYVTIGFSASVNGVVRFFAKGRFLDQISTGSMTANTNTVTIGQDPNTLGSKAHYDLPFCAYWSNRFLSDAEHAEIAANPWQIFKSKPQIYLQPPLQRRIGEPIPLPKNSVVPGQWAKQQQQPLANIARTNPITKDIIACVPASGVPTLYDPVNNFRLVGTGGFTQSESVTVRRTVYGAAYALNGGTYSRRASFPQLPVTPDITLMVVFMPLSNLTNVNLARITGGSGETPSSIGITGSTIDAVQGNDNSATSKITHQNSIIVNKLNVAVYTNTHRTIGARQVLWLNGVPSSTVTTSTAQLNFAGNLLIVGDATTPSASVNFFVVAAWNRILQDAEVISLSQNPWQIFETFSESVSFIPTIQTPAVVIQQITARRRIFLIS